MVVLLGEYMNGGLDAGQRARVETEMNDCFNRSDTPADAWNKSVSWDILAAYRAAAMQRCGIEPPIPGLSWSSLFEPWRQLPKWMQWPMLGFDFRPASLVLDFRPMNQATSDARAFLRNNGMRIPDADPPEPGAPDYLRIGEASQSRKSRATGR